MSKDGVPNNIIIKKVTEEDLPTLKEISINLFLISLIFNI